MHIAEGVLSVTPHGHELLIAGAAATAVGTAIGLWKMDHQRIPQVAVLSACFFVASLLQVPLGGSSVHLVLSGLMGLVLGWAAFPAVLVALLLQAVFFGVGGLTTLGLNTLIMAAPAVGCHYAFRYALQSRHERLVFASGIAAGAGAILAGAMLAGGALMLAGEPYQTLARLFPVAHLPIAAVEGLVTGSVVVLLRKVRPEVLGAEPLIVAWQEAADA